MNRTFVVVSVLALIAYAAVTRQSAKRDAQRDKELWAESR